KINQVTGYDEVERLKKMVVDAENSLDESRQAARQAKEAYDSAVHSRSTAQQQVNNLLERKHSWTDTDVSAFTNLVRQDHSSSSNVTTTSAALRDAERRVDTAFSDLTRSILQRYHEEQVWSDKIRNVSTWVNMAGLIINLVVFLGAIAIVEPWKRKKLVQRVEERMAEMMNRVEGEVKEVARLVAPGVGPALIEQAVSDSEVQPIGTDTSLNVVEDTLDRQDKISSLPWLTTVFQTPEWRHAADLVGSHSIDTDLALAGGVCVTLGVVLGTIIATIVR
ncbi:Mdm33 family-domain-containing protein, partial [Kockovaella imperatae]